MAEIAEANCAAEALAVVDASAQVIGAPTSAEQVDARYKTIRALAIKVVAGEVMSARDAIVSTRRGSVPTGAFVLACELSVPNGQAIPVRLSVDADAGRVNGQPAVFSESGVTWFEEDGGQRLSFIANALMSRIQVAIGEAYQTVPGTCQREVR